MYIKNKKNISLVKDSPQLVT